MASVNGLPKNRAFLDDNLVLNTEGRVAQDELESRIPITGVGSPEDVITAIAGATYYDLTASTGAIHYVKTVNSVGGDGKKGWILA